MRSSLKPVGDGPGRVDRRGGRPACGLEAAWRLLPGLILLLGLTSCGSPGSSSSTAAAPAAEEVVDEVAWPEPEVDETGAPVPPDIAERRRVEEPLAALIRARDFAGIEALFEDARRTKAVMLDGARRLSHYYSSVPNLLALAGIEGGNAQAFYEQWSAAHPESPVPLILLGDLHIDLAWDSRGGGWSSDVTDEGWKGFERELDLAEQVLQRARRLKVKDAELAAKLINVHMGKNYPVEETRRVFEEGYEIDRWDLGPYQSFQAYLLPRWHGEPGELEAFAAEIADRMGGDEGDAIYTRIARMTYNYVGDAELAGVHEFDWARIRRGYAVLRKLYPECPKYYSQEAELAGAFGDRVALENAARALGPKWRKHYLGEAELEAVLQRYDPLHTELRAAAKQHEWEEIDRLLAAGVDVNASGRDGLTVLHIASGDRDAELIRFLASRGADPDKVRPDGWTPLTIAAHRGDTETAEALLDGGADPNEPPGGSPLESAIKQGHADVVRLLLERGAQHAVWYEGGKGPLHLAAQRQRLEVARVLLLQGANPNAVAPYSSHSDPLSQTAPLHDAVQSGNREMIELLLMFGADPDLETPGAGTPRGLALAVNPEVLGPVFDGQDPGHKPAGADLGRALDSAILKRDLPLARSLIEQGADVNQPDPVFQQLPLQRAATLGDTAMLSLLIEHGAKPGALADGGVALLKMGMKPGEEAFGEKLLAAADLKQVPERLRQDLLRSAVSAGRRDFVARALEAGYDVKASIAGGPTLLNIAAQSGGADVIGELVEGGADPNVASEYGWTPLHTAIYHDQEAAAVALIEGGADPNAVLDGKWTPLSLAIGKDQIETVRALLSHGVDTSLKTFDQTPLFKAAFENRPEMIELLLEAGADPNAAATNQQSTPLHGATGRGHEEAVAELLKAPGIDLEAKDVRGYTPLHAAASLKRTELARLLVAAGARRDALSNMKQTPLDLARKGGDRELIAVLEAGDEEIGGAVEAGQGAAEEP